MSSKPNVQKDQAKVDHLREDFADKIESGDQAGAMKDVEQAKEILKRDPKVHP